MVYGGVVGEGQNRVGGMGKSRGGEWLGRSAYYRTGRNGKVFGWGGGKM